MSEKIGCFNNDVLNRDVTYCTDCIYMGTHRCRLNLVFNARSTFCTPQEFEITMQDLIKEILSLRAKVDDLSQRLDQHGHRGLR